MNYEYMQTFSVKAELRARDFQVITRYLEDKCWQDGTVFVYGCGKKKVKIEILLLCMGYNLNKLHTKIQKERTQTHLFEIKPA